MGSKKKAKKAKPKPNGAVKHKRLSQASPRQEDLPGMEDRGIKELEDKANQLDDAQQQKKQYNELCNTLNDDLVALMEKHGKTEYHHKSVHIVLPAQKKKAKVTIGERAEDFPPEDAEDLPATELSENAEVVHSTD